MVSLLIRLIINTIALIAAAYVVNSFSGATGPIESVLAVGPITIGSWESAIMAGLIFGLVNALTAGYLMGKDRFAQMLPFVLLI